MGASGSGSKSLEDILQFREMTQMILVKWEIGRREMEDYVVDLI